MNARICFCLCTCFHPSSGYWNIRSSYSLVLSKKIFPFCQKPDIAGVDLSIITMDLDPADRPGRFLCGLHLCFHFNCQSSDPGGLFQPHVDCHGRILYCDCYWMVHLPVIWRDRGSSLPVWTQLPVSLAWPVDR